MHTPSHGGAGARAGSDRNIQDDPRGVDYRAGRTLSIYRVFSARIRGGRCRRGTEA
jgi:hypothetical protein